jgi:hypothetical protein
MSEKSSVIQRAIENFELCVDATDEIRREAEDDVAFAQLGIQWDDVVKNQRASNGQPCLTVNRLQSSINQVTNDQKQNRPMIKVRAADSGIDPKTADVVNGYLRAVQYQSNAKLAFDCAYDQAVTSSIGFYRVITQYSDDDTFDQDILVKRIEDQFSVYFPINLCSEADYSDAPYCFITTKMSKKDYEKQYKKPIHQWDAVGASPWVDSDTVTIAEYFEVTKKQSKLYQYYDESGELVTSDAIPEGVTAEKEREVLRKKIMWYKLSSTEILEQQEWPGKYIPVIPVLGKEVIYKEQKHYISLTRFSKDPSRMYNYWLTQYTEAVALAPKAPFIGAEGQFEGHEFEWDNAHRENFTRLEYKPTSSGGQLMPPPQKQMPVQPSSGYSDMINIASDDIKVVTGIYDASLGARGNEISGRAILARQQKGDTANYHFIDSLVTSMTLCGKIIIDLMPKIIDTARMIRIVGEDEAEKVVMVNQFYQDEDTGEDVLYNLGKAAKYDVYVDIGPSYQTKRTEAAEALLQFVQAYPAAAQVAGDLIARNMDFPGADGLATRLKKTIPPNLLTPEELAEVSTPNERQQMTQQLQELGQQNQQLQMLVEQMVQRLEDYERQIESKQIEIQQKSEEAVLKSETDLQKTMIQERSDLQQTKIKADVEMMKIMSQMQQKMEEISARIDQIGSDAKQVSVPDVFPGDESTEKGESYE